MREVVDPSPLRPLVDPPFIDDEPTVLADGFDCVGGDPAVALGTLMRLRVGLDVFVERCFVEVSDCHGMHEGTHAKRVSERPSPLEAHKNAPP